MKKISILLVVTLLIVMISPAVLSQELQNIEAKQKGDETVLILTEAQYIALANYIEEIETENKRLQAELDQAIEEVEKAYNNKNSLDFSGLGGAITGAGIAAILISLTK